MSNEPRNQGLELAERLKLRGDKLLDLKSVDLSGVDLSGADLKNVKLPEANLYRANLRETNLQGATLSHADMRCVDLTYANLAHANLAYANLRGASLRGADLHGVVLRGAIGIWHVSAPDISSRGHELFVVDYLTHLMVRSDDYWGDIDVFREQVVAEKGADAIYLDFLAPIEKHWAQMKAQEANE